MKLGLYISGEIRPGRLAELEETALKGSLRASQKPGSFLREKSRGAYNRSEYLRARRKALQKLRGRVDKFALQSDVKHATMYRF